MMTENNMCCWNVLRTIPRTERKLMQCLDAAGYTVFCPMQIVLKKWNGQVKEVFVPLFPGCLFVEASAGVNSAIASSHNSVFLLDNEDKNLVICADKAELIAQFAQLFK